MMGSLMTVVHNANTFGPGCPTAPLDCGGVQLSTYTENSATVLAATGEIDASNINRVTEYLTTALRPHRPLVLDLSKLGFLGAQGVPALIWFDEQCGRAGAEWAVVVSHPVQRLLRIGDLGHRVPTATSVSEALQSLTNPSPARRLLRLVTRSS
jgi:anti-anti-sigma factor